MMLNIAFLAPDIESKIGGHGTFVKSTVRAFKKYLSASCFLIYDRSYDETSHGFKDKHQYIKGSTAALKEFLILNNINIILELGIVNVDIKELYSISKSCGCKIISMVHAKPDFFKVYPSYKSLTWEYRNTRNLVERSIILSKIITFPFYKMFSNNKYLKWRRRLYNYSDKTVVLSQYYIDNFVKMLDLKDKNKVAAIPNSLPFDTSIYANILDNKKDEVLIVSRLIEHSKYLSRVFKVWRIIEKQSTLKNWKLRIVGDGADMNYYKELVTKHKLQNITFEGVQNTKDYYKKSKIFLMSSLHEGFPMTLLEAMQFGLPIVAFDNFESIYELVEDGYNGYIIENNDIIGFATALKQLMVNEQKRKEFAENSINFSNQFSAEIIIKRWSMIFHELLNEKQ